MSWVKDNSWVFLLGILFIGANSYLFFQDNYYLTALPAVLIIAYLGIFHTNTAFLLTVLLTPLSVNLEEFTDGKIGLFVPTEPILFGLMILVVMRQIQTPYLDKQFWRHPITLSLGFYLIWLFVTSITSTNPGVSFKYMLMKLWYIIPILFIGVELFKKKANISRFLWLYSIGMTVVILYTLVRHYSYGFGEEEGHWVMSPFFKDHTIYGAGVAISLLFIIGLFFAKRHNPLVHLTLLVMLAITLLGLYFSYTRGAWLSVVFAGIVWLLIRFKVKFKYLLTIGLSLVALVFIFWTQIEIELARNKQEHTTTAFDERLQSAANITSDASNLERLNRWDAALAMFYERPVFGFGPGTYAFEYAPYQDPDNLTIISTNFGNMGNAHSEFLGPLAEMGALGILSIIIFVSALFYKGITLYIRLKNNYPERYELRLLLLSSILSMSTYFFHGLLNNYLDTDKASIPVYGVCAMIIAIEIMLKKEKEVKS